MMFAAGKTATEEEEGSSAVLVNEVHSLDVTVNHMAAIRTPREVKHYSLPNKLELLSVQEPRPDSRILLRCDQHSCNRAVGGLLDSQIGIVQEVGSFGDIEDLLCLPFTRRVAAQAVTVSELDHRNLAIAPVLATAF